MSESIINNLRDYIEAIGSAIPSGDMPVFINNMLVSGVSVWADAALFLVAGMLLVKPENRGTVVLLITLAHAIYGYFGLIILSAEAVYLGWSLGIIIALSSYAGLRFIIEGLDGDEDGSPSDDASKINIAIIGGAAIGVYSGVSIDELFMVLQRYQWMTAQGWDDTVKAANIGGSMIVLYALLWVVKWVLEKGHSMEWLEERGDNVMFGVFALMMYYIVRGVLQNGLGYVPLEIPYTGIAPELLAVGFVFTWILKRILRNETSNRLLNKIFLLG